MPRTNSTTSNGWPNNKFYRPLVGANFERCLYCASPNIVRAGKRYKQHEILQRWYCHSCAVFFSPRTAGKGSTYPLKVILETLCRFYQGHTIDRTADYTGQVDADSAGLVCLILTDRSSRLEHPFLS